MLNPKAASRHTESKVPGILSNTQNMRLPRNSCHFKAPRGTNLQQHKNRKAAAAKTKISKPKKLCQTKSAYKSRATTRREKVLGMRTRKCHPQTIRNCEDARACLTLTKKPKKGVCVSVSHADSNNSRSSIHRQSDGVAVSVHNTQRRRIPVHGACSLFQNTRNTSKSHPVEIALALLPVDFLF